MKLLDSNDPALNATMFIMACAIGLVLFALSAAIAIPVLAVIGIAKGVHWYYTTPMTRRSLGPTDTDPRQPRGLPFSRYILGRYHCARLLDHYEADNLPSYLIFHKMVVIAGTLHEAEGLANPLPPLPPGNPYRRRQIPRLPS